MATRVTSTRLVGRAGELAELEAALADAAGGCPSLVFVAGESGVGKTRLLAELSRRAESADARVLRGGGVPGEEELPYGPILAALRPLARDGDPVLAGLPRSARAELARLLPALGDVGPERDGADDREQLHLFEALLTLLDRLGASAPVVLEVEDLHWIDRSTRAFVAFLASSLQEERVVVVLTYRPEELHRRHPLRPLLAELERTAGARRIELAPLTPEELQEALADILGAAPTDEVLARLYARSQGNPLYAEELLAAGLDGRGAPPSTLSDALRIRTDGLSGAAQDAMRAVAVGGRVDQAQLEAITGLDGHDLRDGLRETIEAHALVAAPDGRIGFRHALLAEVIYEDLLPGERAELHLALARVLEAGMTKDPGAADGLAAGVAHHYQAAGDQPSALTASVRAAEAAERTAAHAEAASTLERALRLWPRVADAEARAGLDHAALLTRAADAHLAGGDRARAEVLARSALDELDPAVDPRRVAGLLWRLARAQRTLGRADEAAASAQQALAILPPGTVSPERAALLDWWARSRMLRGRYTEAIAAARDAVRAADAAGDIAAGGRALNTLGFSLMMIGQVEEGASTLRDALAIARRLDGPDDLQGAFVNLADGLSIAGRTREALATAREGLAALSELVGREPDWLRVSVAEYAFEAGEWEEAAARLPAPAQRFVGRGLIHLELRRAELGLGRGGLAREALVALDPLVVASNEAQFHGVYGALLAEACRREGDLDAARAAVAAALDRLEFCTDDSARIARAAAAGVAVEADEAQRARDRGDAAGAKRAVARARSLMSRVRAAARAGGPVERAWRAKAEAELERGRGAPDPARAARCAEAWTALDRPYRAALGRWREAEAHLELGAREPAARAAETALGAARALGAGWLEEEVAGLVARGRLQLRDGAPAPAPPEETPFGLTPRECQVLELVAAGATNREIGSALYMAEKTASVHVSRILAKLQVRSRTQAAAMAHRMGLG